jgi:hypothetical protein
MRSASSSSSVAAKPGSLTSEAKASIARQRAEGSALRQSIAI